MRHRPPLVVAIALVVACSAPSEAQSPSPESAQVPPQAPDRLPERLFDPNSLRNLPCITGPADRGIVVVRFEDGATQAQKQEAVDRVDREVVGGLASETREGFYYVVVEDDPDGEVVCAAVETLDSMPQVSIASLSVPSYTHRRWLNEDAR